MSVREDEDETPVPWWTEWLCGCSEGPDRGGELQVRPVTYIRLPQRSTFTNFMLQAGRTNPLE